DSHVLQGIVMFVVGGVALFAVDQALLRLLPSRGARAADAVPPAQAAAPTRGPAGALALALCVMGALASLSGRADERVAPSPAPSGLPAELAGWTVREGPSATSFAGSVRFVHASSRTYEHDGAAVWVFLGEDDRRLRFRSILSAKNALPGTGWETEERREVELDPGAVRMQAVVARRFGQRSVTYHAYRGSESLARETWRAALALDQAGSPFARADGARLLRLTTSVPPGPDGVREAEARLRRLFSNLAPALGW
ncbi:MAG: EpsI family protein, partial [Actinobacteria bacterium]|nr:EpsI family protein [Actinomycetota bacterium]